jgi:glycosyltransferase involved in cell wall biosynthesis
MCDAWAEKDNRIKVLHIDNNGVANARNQGLKLATGDFIGFVDSDDYIKPNMYETLLDNLVKNNADISVCGYQICDEPNVQANLRAVSQFDALKLICVGDYKYGILWNKLYKKEVVSNIEMPHYVCCEDLIFNYYVFKNAKTIVECDSKLYYYYQNENGAVNGKFSIGAFDAVHSKEEMLAQENNTPLADYATKGYICSCFVLLSECVQNNAFPDKAQKLIDNILKYRKEILSLPLYSKNDKIKTIVLSVSPKLYRIFIKRMHRND